MILGLSKITHNKWPLEGYIKDINIGYIRGEVVEWGLGKSSNL